MKFSVTERDIYFLRKYHLKIDFSFRIYYLLCIISNSMKMKFIQKEMTLIKETEFHHA